VKKKLAKRTKREHNPFRNDEKDFLKGKNMEKDKALEAALSQIERAFGKGSIMRYGQDTKVDIEAISTGIPVLCARAGALPEIAGDSALYFNPDDTEEFASLIQQVIEDKSLRKRLISNGLDRVKLFSWKNTAIKTLEVLEKAVKV
jgi:hypothetical protein